MNVFYVIHKILVGSLTMFRITPSAISTQHRASCGVTTCPSSTETHNQNTNDRFKTNSEFNSACKKQQTYSLRFITLTAAALTVAPQSLAVIQSAIARRPQSAIDSIREFATASRAATAPFVQPLSPFHSASTHSNSSGLNVQ